MGIQLSEGEVIKRASNLPAFPRVVNDILQTLEDDGAALGTLVHFVETDPVITARILSVANSAALGARQSGQVRNVQMAISLIGLARVREIALAVSLAEFAQKSQMSAHYWEHSLAVAITAQELGRFTHFSSDHALVAGLLHDIGQLWMARCYPLEFQMVRTAVNVGKESICEVEQHYFGLDHCAIGSILASQWRLPTPVIAAILYHHAPNPDLPEKLVKLASLTHVAEVLANALDLSERQENQVHHLSEEACACIGLDWESDLNALFGKIEARTENACRVFR
ncbi:MAG: HDOD domain-containing protein [Bacteroidota bacterium]